MGKWNKLNEKSGNLSRHPNRITYKGTTYTNNWTPIIEMFGAKFENHPWIVNTIDNKSIKMLIPHHLISISSLDYINKRYKKVLLKNSYNVNHPKNLLLLPGVPSLACELKVPRHEGNHTSWTTVQSIIPEENIEKIKDENKGKDFSKGYHFYVSSKVRKEIKKLLKKCKNIKNREVVDKVDSLSKILAKEISTGRLLLHPGSERYFIGGEGCSSSCKVKNRSHNFYELPDIIRELGYNSERLKTAYEIYK